MSNERVTDAMVEVLRRELKTFKSDEDLRRALTAALSAEQTQQGVEEDLDARMKAAGMFTVAEMMGVTPLTKWMSNPSINTLGAFSDWLERKVYEYLRMKAAYDLGDKSQDDELFEWVEAHAAVFGTIRDQFKVVRSALVDVPAVEQEPVAFVSPDTLASLQSDFGGLYQMKPAKWRTDETTVPLYTSPVRSVVPAPAEVGHLPRLNNCGTYLAKDNKGDWHYLSHAKMWCGYQGPQGDLQLQALLKDVLRVLDSYANPTSYLDSNGEYLTADAVLHDGLLAKDPAAKIRSALSTSRGYAEDSSAPSAKGQADA